MTQSDRTFITGLFTKLDVKIDTKIDGVEKNLSEQIRQQGVLMEAIEDKLLRVAENLTGTNEKVDRLQKDIDEIKDNVVLKWPALWEVVKKHSRILSSMGHIIQHPVS